MQTSYSKHTRNSAKQAVKDCLESDGKSTEDIKKTIQHSQLVNKVYRYQKIPAQSGAFLV